MIQKSILVSLAFFLTLAILPSSAFAACDDGRVLCSHGCDSRQRPACKDSKGNAVKPYCVTPGYCRDGASPRVAACEAGWSSRTKKCTGAERANRGCQDKRGMNGSTCVRFTR